MSFTSWVEHAGKPLRLAVDIEVAGFEGPLPLAYAKELLVQLAVAITNPEEFEEAGAKSRVPGAGVSDNRQQVETGKVKAAVKLAQLAIAFEQAHAVFFPAGAVEMAELGSQVMAEAGVGYWISPSGDSITCTKCRRTSHNRNDVAQRYCGFCHEFHPPQSHEG